MPAKSLPPISEEPPSLAARCIKQLLERHGLPRYRHASTIAEVLGISKVQAHRRAVGAAAWSLEEMAALARHFKEPLCDVVGPGEPKESHEALLMVGSLRAPCRVWLGKLIEHKLPVQLVAVGVPGNWQVMLSTDTQLFPAMAVRRMVVQEPSSTSDEETPRT
jgi:hypothetical protein